MSKLIKPRLLKNNAGKWHVIPGWVERSQFGHPLPAHLKVARNSTMQAVDWAEAQNEKEQTK